MLLTQLDMPAARYAFAYIANGDICQKREGFISYRIGAKRQYIELERSESISSKRSLHIDRKKTRVRVQGEKPYILALFSVFYMGLGLSPFVFD